MKTEFKILSLNISLKKGEQKKPVDKFVLKINHGIVGDAHAGNWHRQISLLADEDIDTMRGKGMKLNFGDFAENITTKGIDLSKIPIGTRLYMGDAVLEITQIGKECHHGCEIFQKIGDCVMPRKGIFAKVIEQGEITCESYCYYTVG
jgi:cyclic pyranopterin phosphate synthase